MKGELGFRDLKDFNIAFLAKQLWRLIHNSTCLAFQILKARYFLDYAILDATLRRRPSYTWRSLWGVRWVIDKGSR